MPIYLPVPGHVPGGPDGQGWNRVSIGSLAGDQCALRPTSYPTYYESLDTRRARYGGFGPCIRSGDCDACPVLQRHSRLDAFDDRILVRIHPDQPGVAYLMNRPEDGWSSTAQRWTWERLSSLTGWDRGPNYRDEHSAGFWLVRATAEGAAS